MALLLFWLTCFIAHLSNYGFVKSRACIGSQPPPGNAIYTMYILGGALSWILLVVLFIGGFFIFPWWMPITAVVFTGLVAGPVYMAIPLEECVYPIFGFPLAVVGTILTFVLA
jgi:hypothetical protein